MKAFMDDTFMLDSETAVQLYNNYAKGMPIIDYHCHLSPQEIWEDKRFANLAEVWLYGDHYKWRAMRANGVEERFVTGAAGVTDYDRFLAWCETVPYTLGNPLYHWSHMELRHIFGITARIGAETAPQIWEAANARLAEESFTVRGLIRSAGVETVCTTDDPADSLEYHLKLKQVDDLGFRVLPSFRPDKALGLTRGTFLPWLQRMGDACGYAITDYAALLRGLEDRVRFFHEAGTRVSDHALDEVPYAEATQEEAAAIFAKALRGEAVSRHEEWQYQTYTLLVLGRLYAQRGWAMQLHINAHRNNNTRMEALLGPDTGYDSINDNPVAGPLVKLLNALEQEQQLPKTILYSLNANDNDILASIAGSFQGGGVPGKMQLGSAWWFNDTKEGMRAQLLSLANIGLLSRFVGMLTDSRSFLSYPRHDYFRRILCSLLGEWVERGEAPDDEEWLGGIVQAISYRNAKDYFGFDREE
ncbi:glucuronate isomerase [Paenibacillus solisilvae]|uniref:Uronate isomerase n=1 Tax=Paenibacillus solisilvae TaxID=2486751 RepID=A0ABW0W1S7_9BACL